MRLVSAVFGCLTVCLGALGAGAEPSPAVPSLAAMKVARPPVIDGRLTDDCWNQAAAATGFWIWDGSGRADNSATAKIVYDDRGLYVAFQCPLKDAAAVQQARAEKAEQILGSKHIVEVFLEPFPYHARVYHFMVNAAGGRHCELNGNSQWRTQWTSAVFVGTDFWIAEIGIPFAALACGDAMMPEWGLNLTCGLTCWAPTFGSFHRIDRFGKLTNLKIDGRDYRWSTAVVAQEGTVGEVPLDIKLVNQTGKSRRIRLRADVFLNGADRSPRTFNKDDLRVAENRDAAFQFTVPLTEHKPYPVELQVIDAETGKVLAVDAGSIMGPRAFSAHWDRSFYMSEDRAKLTLNCRLKGAAGAVFRCRVLSPDSARVMQERTLTLDKSRRGAAIFDLAAIPAGQYPVSVTAVKGLASAAGPAVEPLRKLTPKTGAVQYTEQGVLLRDGKPFFPFGLYYVSRYLDGEFLKEYAEAGFNTFILDWRSAAEFVKFAERVKPHGLVPLVTIKDSYDVSTIKGEDAEAQNRRVQVGRELVRTVAAGTDNLWGWYTCDEPPLAHLPLVRRFHDAVREIDPYHPSFYVSCLPHLFGAFAEASDIHAPDPYPGFPGGRIRKVSDYLDAMTAAVGPGRPVMAVLQTFYEEGGRMPSPRELRCMAYLSVVHGARGILFFSYDYRVGPMAKKNPETWKALKALAREFQALAPVFLAPDQGTPVTVVGGRGVDTKTFRHDSACYVVAVNPENQPANQVKFILDAAGAEAKVEVVGEGRNVPLRNGAWTDDLAPHDVRVYRIGKRP